VSIGGQDDLQAVRRSNAARPSLLKLQHKNSTARRQAYPFRHTAPPVDL